jgi:hypothetical protein
MCEFVVRGYKNIAYHLPQVYMIDTEWELDRFDMER